MARNFTIKDKKPATLNLLESLGSGDQSDVSTADVSPPDVSPRAIALAQISKLSRSIESGENLQECANALEAIASVATMELWRLKHLTPKTREALEEVARQNTGLPVIVSPVPPPNHWRSTKKKAMPLSVQDALDLPIGEALPFKLRGNGLKRDYLYYLITEVLYPEFQLIRRAPPSDSSLDQTIQALPDICKATAKQWALAMTQSVIEDRWPYREPGTWIHDSVLKPKLKNLSSGVSGELDRKSKEKKRQALKSQVEHGTVVGSLYAEVKLKELESTNPTDTRHRRSLRERINTKLESILKI